MSDPFEILGDQRLGRIVDVQGDVGRGGTVVTVGQDSGNGGLTQQNAIFLETVGDGVDKGVAGHTGEVDADALIAINTDDQRLQLLARNGVGSHFEAIRNRSVNVDVGAIDDTTFFSVDLDGRITHFIFAACKESNADEAHECQNKFLHF